VQNETERHQKHLYTKIDHSLHQETQFFAFLPHFRLKEQILTHGTIMRTWKGSLGNCSRSFWGGQGCGLGDNGLLLPISDKMDLGRIGKLPIIIYYP